MTTVGTRTRAPMRATAPAHAGLRLLRLYLTSRRATTVLVVIVAGAVALGFASRSRATAQVLPLVIETTAAMVIVTTTSSPFGGPERATGRWLPYLRLTAVTTLTMAAIAVLSTGSALTHAPGGALGVMRDVAGLTGVGLLTAAFVGTGPAWTGLMTYLVIARHAMSAGWTTPWTWPARPPHDRGAALCAALVFIAGTAVITASGARVSARE